MVTRCWSNLAAAVFVGAVAAYRFRAVDAYEFAGHGDGSFYFLTAKNIATGEGPVIPYVWHFLVEHRELTHYAFDYWMPGASLVFAAAMQVFSPTVRAVAIVSIAAAVALSLNTWIAARQLTTSPWIPPAAAAIIAILAPINEAAVGTETVALYAALASGALTAMLLAGNRPGGWVVAGFLAGLAHLTRNDGVLLLAVALASIWIRHRDDVWLTLRLVACAGTGYAMLLLPLFVVNIAQIGTPLPPSLSVMPLITSYEDIYSTQRAALPTVAQILSTRRDAVVRNFATAFRDIGIGSLASMLALAAAAFTSQRRFVPLLSAAWFAPPVLFGLLLFALHSLVTPVVSSAGAWEKSLPSLLPFLVILALEGAERLAQRFKIPRWAVFSIAIAAMGTAGVMQLFSITVATVSRNNRAGSTELALKPILESEAACLDRELVVMTRRPWQLTEATGFRALMIPNDGLERILETGAQYRATHLLWPAPRQALADFDAITQPRGPFQVVGRVDARVLLRLPDVVIRRDCRSHGGGRFGAQE